MPLTTSYSQLGGEALRAAHALENLINERGENLEPLVDFSWTLASEPDLQDLDSFRKAGADTISFLLNVIRNLATRRGTQPPDMQTVSDLYPHMHVEVTALAKFLNGERTFSLMRQVYEFCLAFHDMTINEQERGRSRFALSA